MKSLKKIFTKKKEPEVEEYVSEVPITKVSETLTTERIGEIEPIYIKSIETSTIEDVEKAVKELEDGNIPILDISSLMDEDPAELKEAIDRLRMISEGMGGNVGRLSETKVIATPRFVKIQFERIIEE